MLSLPAFAAGWLAAMVLIGGLAVVAVGVRRRLVPGWIGAWARLAEVVTAVAVLTVISEALGLAGWLDAWPLTTAVAAVAAGSWWYGRSRRRRGPPDRNAHSRSGPVAWRVAAASAGLGVAAVWMTSIELTLRKGMYDFDTLVYHGPFAARFARTASVAGLHQIATGQAIAYHPATAELLHAIGILLLGTDLLTPLANAAWTVVALLAAWCLGSRWMMGAAAAACVAVLALAPGVVGSQAATAGNDVAGMALFLAAAALVVRSDATRGARLLAALAGGLAVGTKLSLVVPVAALAVLVVVRARPGSRHVAGVAWPAATLLTGGYWYVRNLAITGNPVPALRLSFGPVDLNRPEMPVFDRLSDTVLLDATAARWSTVYHPGLDEFFGPCWWLVLGAALAGIVLALGAPRGEALRRGLGAVAAAALAGYLVTPTAGATVVFAANLRYALPPVALGLILLASALPRAPRAVHAIAIAMTAGTAAVTVARVAPWSLPSWEYGRAVGVALVTLVGVVAALWSQRDNRRVQRGLAVGGLIVLLALPLAARGVQSRFLDGRYADAEGDLGVAFRFGREASGERIGVSGAIEHYPLFGPTFANSVQYIADEKPDTSFRDVTSCRTWTRAVARGGYSVVVISRSPIDVRRSGPPPEAEWAALHPALRLLARSGHTSIWTVDGDRDVQVC